MNADDPATLQWPSALGPQNKGPRLRVDDAYLSPVDVGNEPMNVGEPILADDYLP